MDKRRARLKLGDQEGQVGIQTKVWGWREIDGTQVGRVIDFLLIRVWCYLINRYHVHILSLSFLPDQKFL